jgi:hypothetical protein
LTAYELLATILTAVMLRIYGKVFELRPVRAAR